MSKPLEPVPKSNPLMRMRGEKHTTSIYRRRLVYRRRLETVEGDAMIHRNSSEKQHEHKGVGEEIAKNRRVVGESKIKRRGAAAEASRTE